MKVVLWELHSASDLSARCAHQHAPPTAHLITVYVGDSERVSEPHCTEADAHDEATHLLAHFLAKGWTEVTYRDQRIALP